MFLIYFVMGWDLVIFTTLRLFLSLGVAIPVPPNEGVVVFGTPIGHPDWVQLKLRELLSAH